MTIFWTKRIGHKLVSSSFQRFKSSKCTLLEFRLDNNFGMIVSKKIPFTTLFDKLVFGFPKEWSIHIVSIFNPLKVVIFQFEIYSVHFWNGEVLVACVQWLRKRKRARWQIKDDMLMFTQWKTVKIGFKLKCDSPIEINAEICKWNEKNSRSCRAYDDLIDEMQVTQKHPILMQIVLEKLTRSVYVSH